MLIRAGSLLQFRNKLAYPWGLKPGFDPDHLAMADGAGVCRFSAVNIGASFVNLLNGRGPNTTAGTPVQSVAFGMPVCSTSTATTQYTFSSNVNLASDITHTIAVIFYTTAASTKQVIFQFGAVGTNGYGIETTALNQLSALVASTSAGGTINLSANIPYFAVIGRIGTGTSQQFMLLLNLNTGAILTTTNTLSTAETAPTQVSLMCGSGGSALQGGLAACAYIGGVASLQIYKAWAADPWSFWFPIVTPIDWVGKIAAATSRVPLRMRMGMGV